MSIKIPKLTIRIPEFSQETVEYLHEVGKLLDEKLSDTAEFIKEHSSELASHRARLGVLLGKVEYLLKEKKSFYLSDSGTVLEKEIALDNSVKDYDFYRDLLEEQIKSMDKILSLGQSILSYEKTHLQILGVVEQ